MTIKDRNLFWAILILAAFVILVWLVPSAWPQAAHYRHEGGYTLNDPTVTPGVVNPAIEADRSGSKRLLDGVEVNICAKDFRTKPFRRTTEAMKRKVCQEYGSTDCPNPVKGEVDHLIPLELGGKDDVGNLWWQPAPEYHVKDHQVEDVLPRLVCAGKINLKEAQACLAVDWVSCATRVKGLQ